MPTIGAAPRSVLTRLPVYTPGKPIWEVQQELGLDRIIKLASNENPLGASPKATEAMQAWLTELHRYPDASAASLREAVASSYDVSKEGVIASNGADELIKLLSEAYLEPGDEIVIPVPTFTEYEFAARLMGAEVVPVPLVAPDYRYDVEALLRAVTPRTKLIYLCSPNNPTGTYLRQAEAERLLRALPQGVLVVLDAAYSHYAEEEDYTNGVEWVKQGAPVLVMQTFSKVYGLAGLRVGFGIASEEVIGHIQRVREPFNVNALAQAAAAAALKDEEHVEMSRQCVAEGRNQLYRKFDELGLAYTRSSSNFILVQVGALAEDVYKKLLQNGIIVRHGAQWGLPQHVRITVGTEEENLALGEALQRVL
ncbi:histidinol-phosphate transaminase [Paenibacillus silviterrae]|uniref:histidinol-phosphate transaminase n=1 Tax=Paenibacillus silviterrae TaxID=3242194 RepID=UPI002543C69B|nr:histidinol-phosphate transaminase [Paenibacillus chinjuensis]